MRALCNVAGRSLSSHASRKRCALTFGFIYLFIYFATCAFECETNRVPRETSLDAVLRSEARSQERRSQFCATSMSRMSSIAGVFRLAYTANDRYPDARIMDVSVTRRTLRMQRIIVMRDGRRRCVRTPHVSRKPLLRLFILLMRMIVKRGRNLALLSVKKNAVVSRSLG